MAKVIFFGTPAHGHTNPTLPVVKEMAARGIEVYYFSTPEFADKIASSNAIFREYPLQGIGIDSVGIGKNLALLYHALVMVTQRLIKELLEQVDQIKPDYIIHDSISVWGRYVAEIRRIPAICSVTTFAFSERGVSLWGVLQFIQNAGFKGLGKFIEAEAIQRQLHEQYGVKPAGLLGAMMNREPLNIVFTSRLFQPDDADFAASSHKFVGPSITERKNDPDATDYAALPHPLIYVSMGTIWKHHLDLDLFIAALSGFGGSMVFSSPDTTQKFADAPNIIIKSHVNQIEVLRHCDAFISHGGMNSVSEALYWQVPLCVIPFQLEQADVARRVAELGCGIRLQKPRQAAIRQAVGQLLGDASYKENCRLVAESFKEAGGYRKAVDWILEYAGKLAPRGKALK